MKRALVLLLACVLARAASADGFVEAMGGGAFPLGDARWKVGPTYNLGIRAGWTQHDGFGALVQTDWTPEPPEDSMDSIAVTNAYTVVAPLDVALDRFRVLGDVTYQRHVARGLALRARLGAGVDVMREARKPDPNGSSPLTHLEMTDANVAVEAGIGAWWELAHGVALGAELAVPFSHHAHAGIPASCACSPGTIAHVYQAKYTSWDLVAELGLRVTFGGGPNR